jgi:1-acyl-sn-glycerol-3-phosphate acyltransferase
MNIEGARPGPLELAAMRLVLAPWKRLTAPRFYGLTHVPTDRPVLLAGNHTVMGLLDAPLMVLGLRERRGIVVRSLGDHLHFRIPGWRLLLERGGVVEGTPENCHALMRGGETILVFPGGGREVFKRKGEKYRLLWGERLGFVRLAIEHGYPIVPFGAVGAEECFDILLDAGDVLAVPLLGRLLTRLVPRIDELPPLVRGIGPTPLPRPERFYFAFGPAIETRRFAGRHRDAVLCAAVRDQVRRAVEMEIAFLLAERRRDPERTVVTRALRWLGVSPGGTPDVVRGADVADGEPSAAIQRPRLIALAG